ncbi:MAG: PAS domain S-box protein [Propionibacteriales bacterium]|nr:PAS domain S-box protein [Propionibacteriales bacterium]
MSGQPVGTMSDVSDVRGTTRISVVLVDDSSQVRGVVRRALELTGLFEVVGEGGDGDEAIGLVYRHEPSLLLLDTSMPTADGLEAVPGILALCPQTRVVMFTGFEDAGLAARARELGAADVVSKSILLEDLPGRLLRILTDGPGTPPPGTPPPGTRHRLRLVDDSRVRFVADEQAVLDQHLAQFRDLFDRAAIGMATLTVTGTIVRPNRAFADLMSCSPYELVGADYGRLTGGGGAMLDRGLEAIKVFDQDVASFEHPLPSPPGGPPSRIARVTLSPIRDAQEQVLYVFAQVQDISAQREAEDSLRRSEDDFRLLVSSVREYAIFMLDRTGNVISWNSGAQRIKGYAANEIVGHSFRVFYSAEERASGHPEGNLEAALRKGTLAEEGWRVRKDGSQFWASVVISPVYDDAGSHIGFAKVTRDQTQRREHEEERRKSMSQQAHLLAVTAHELRNPTAVIDGSARTLRASGGAMSDDERDELLAAIRSSAHRLHRLASDLTTASRLHEAPLELRRQDVSLTEILRRAAKRVQTTGSDVQVDVTIAHETTLNVDGGRLAQALDNLLDNAVRHGAPPIQLDAVVDEEIHIRVTDAGSGVSSALVPHLFEQFATAGPARRTGLGLHIVREIARAHGGDAEYRPPGPGQPTTFALRLPWRT